MGRPSSIVDKFDLLAHRQLPGQWAICVVYVHVGASHLAGWKLSIFLAEVCSTGIV